MPPFRQTERYRRSQGYRLVAGIDEVGRGAWAGPLVAAALILKPYARLPNLKDSKQLTPRQRRMFAIKIAHGALVYRWGIVQAREIDDIGIAKANELAFRRALEALRPRPHYVLADFFSLNNFRSPVEGIFGGDEKVRVIAAASVLAKVFRDDLMALADRHYPGYDFHKHKGYGTAAHRQAIKKLGPSAWHRLSFDVY